MRAIVDACLGALPPAEAARVQVSIESEVATVYVPPRALRRCLGSLIRNAIDASESGTRVGIEARRVGAFVHIAVRDQGVGMSGEDVAKAGEPFWTTNPPGRGMGLGIFLVRATLDQIGGRLDLQASPERGTTAIMSLPTAPQPS